MMASAAKAGGTKIIVASALRLFHGLGHRVEDRHAFNRLAAAAGSHSADHLRAVFQAVLGMELSGGSGDALAEHAGIAIDENAHKIQRLYGWANSYSRLPTFLSLPCRANSSQTAAGNWSGGVIATMPDG